MKTSKLQTVGVPLLTLIGLIGTLLKLKSSGASGPTFRPDQNGEPFHLEVLTQQKSEPGKVLTVKSGNQRVASFKFLPDEAGGAIIRASREGDSRTLPVVVGTGTDKFGHHYATRIRGEGSCHFITILRGYARSVDDISMPLYFVPRLTLAAKERPSTLLKVATLAPPIRTLGIPSKKETIESEKFATAVFDPLTHSIKVKPAKDHLGVATILQTSFSSPWIGTQDIPLSRRGIDHEYDDDTDVIKLKYQEYVAVTQHFTGTYKKAIALIRGGVGELVFPTTQVIGKLGTRTVTVEKRLASDSLKDPARANYSSISIRIQPSDLATATPTGDEAKLPKEIATEINSKISGASMDFDGIDISVTSGQEILGSSRYKSTRVLEAEAGFHELKNRRSGPDEKTIEQELTITFTVTSYQPKESIILVLPVHRNQRN